MAVNKYNKGAIAVEVALRIILGILCFYFDTIAPFERYISKNELSDGDISYPMHESYVPGKVLWWLVIAVPLTSLLVANLLSRIPYDFTEGLLSISLGILLDGLLTNIIKTTVGRPRPDFFYRCFPDGVMTVDLKCTGDPHTIQIGRKSFPSGHSSLSFASLGWISLWLMGRLGVMNQRGRGRGVRLVIALQPMCVAMLIAISRTCDYHHHWQDVLVGSLLGLSCAWTCYRLHYSSLSSESAGHPYIGLNHPDSGRLQNDYVPIMGCEENLKISKWI